MTYATDSMKNDLILFSADQMENSDGIVNKEACM